MVELFTDLHRLKPTQKRECSSYNQYDYLITFKNLLVSGSWKNENQFRQVFESLKNDFKVPLESLTSLSKISASLELLLRQKTILNTQLRQIMTMPEVAPTETSALFLIRLQIRQQQVLQPLFQQLKALVLQMLNDLEEKMNINEQERRKNPLILLGKMKAEGTRLQDFLIRAREIQRTMNFYLTYVGFRRNACQQMLFQMQSSAQSSAFFILKFDQFLFEIPIFIKGTAKAHRRISDMLQNMGNQLSIAFSFDQATNEGKESFRLYVRETSTLFSFPLRKFRETLLKFREDQTETAPCSLDESLKLREKLRVFFIELCQQQIETNSKTRKKLTDALLQKQREEGTPLWYQQMIEKLVLVSDALFNELNVLTDAFTKKEWVNPYMKMGFNAKFPYEGIIHDFENNLFENEPAEDKTLQFDNSNQWLSWIIDQMTQRLDRMDHLFLDDTYVRNCHEQTLSTGPEEVKRNARIGYEQNTNLERHVKYLEAINYLTFDFFSPFYPTLRETLEIKELTQEERESIWMNLIDSEEAETVKPLPKQAPILVSKHSRDKAADVKTPVTTAGKSGNKTAKQKKPAKVTLGEWFYDLLQLPGVASPASTRNARLEPWHLFDLDQSYHFSHVQWSIDLMRTILQKNATEMLPWVIPALNNYLYLAQEQAVMPHYLARHPNKGLTHGLVEKNRELQFLPLGGHHDQGSFWFRYPNASFHYFKTGHARRLALEVNLKVEQDSPSGSYHEVLPVLPVLVEEGVDYLVNRALDRMGDEQQEQGTLLKKLKEDLLKEVKGLTKTTPSQQSRVVSPFPVETVELVENYALQIEQVLDLLQRKLDSLEFEARKHSKLTLSDLKIHLRRFSRAIQLYIHFPDQRFLSLHMRNLLMSLQYISELSGVIHSLSQNDEVHTHNLNLYQMVLEWDRILDRRSIQFLQDIDLRKGIDYIYRKYAKNEGKVAQGLRWLNEAYLLSLSATQAGEGFISAHSRDKNDANMEKTVNKIMDEGTRLILDLWSNILSKI